MGDRMKLFLTIVASAALTAVSFAGAAELFADPAFTRGFNVTAARHPAPKIELGALRFPGGSDEPPVWRLAQWGSRHLIEPGLSAQAGEGKWIAETPGKRVVVERPTDGIPPTTAGGRPNGILLEVNGGAEYEGRYRRMGESWPHLLIEQKFNPLVQLAAAGELRLGLEFRVAHCEVAPGMESGLDPGLHTAQVSAFFTVHTAIDGKPNPGEMFWFGIPLFDARHAVPPGHYALDIAPGGGGKFICNLDGNRFWQGNTGDGEWRRLDADLPALLREALGIAQQHGQFKDRRFDDLALTSFNLGWEVPGPYNAAIELRGLSLRAK
jgi:hypothetical protein